MLARAADRRARLNCIALGPAALTTATGQRPLDLARSMRGNVGKGDALLAVAKAGIGLRKVFDVALVAATEVGWQSVEDVDGFDEDLIGVWPE